jgi:hypothetical protein
MSRPSDSTSRSWVAKAEQQLDEGGLAAARWADHPDDLAWIDRRADVAEDRCVGGVFEGDVVEAESADRGDRLAVVNDSGVPVASEFIVERTKERQRRIDRGDRRLHCLAVAERSQHDQHDGSDRRQARRVDGSDDGERTDECEVGHPGVHRRHQATEEGEALCGGFGVVDQVDDAFGCLGLHVEHMHLHAELGGLAERRREVHPGSCRASRLPLHRRSQWSQHRAQNGNGCDHHQRSGRIDHDGRYEHGDEAASRGDRKRRGVDKLRSSLSERRQQLLQTTRTLTVLRRPGCLHERLRQSRRTSPIQTRSAVADCHVVAIASATRTTTNASATSTAVVTLTSWPAIRPNSSLPSVIANAARVIATRNKASTRPPSTEVAASAPTSIRRFASSPRTPPRTSWVRLGLVRSRSADTTAIFALPAERLGYSYSG